MLNDDITLEILAEVNRLGAFEPNRKLTRNMVRRGSRILDRLALLCSPEENKMTAKMQTITAFKSMRIAYDCPPDRDYMEFIMRSPAEERELVGKLNLPAIPRMDSFHFYKTNA